jgi:Signal transduction histidine kinase
MKSIYGKLIIGFLVSIVFSFSVAGYFTIRKNSSELSQLTYEELNNSSDYVINLMKIVDSSDLSSVLGGYAKTSEVNFLIEHEKESVGYGNMYNSLKLTNDEKSKLYNYPEIVVYKNQSSIKQLSKSFVMNNQKYIITIQKDSGNRESIFLNSAVIALFCILSAGSVMFLVLADIIVKPISRLNKATNELSKGNYRVRVNYSGNDEIATLNRSFNQMAQQLAKTEEIRQQFISDVSHEFQTPLTAIQGFATILKNEQLPDEQRQKYADIILFHSKRLSTLSKNMLQLTLLEGEDLKLNKTEFSLVEQLIRVISTQDPLALKKDIEIEFNRPKNDIFIEADEARLEQVWINLLNNAIKYTNEHGVVTVTVKRGTKEVEVSIADTGVGMSKEAISHIFERFYRQDKSRNVEGNGLGLSIVKRIVDLHLGTIDVESREEAGSVFSVKLPYERNFLGKFNNLTKKEEKG